MSTEERKKWEDMAKKGKERYKIEMAIYSGPSTVPKCGKRYIKDKSAPKRPMSAYLDYSKTFRSQVIRDNPHVKDNREISKILGSMWKNSTEKEKQPFISNEKILREKYNDDADKWRKVRDERIKAHRAAREEMVQQAIDNGTSDELVQVAKQCKISSAAIPQIPAQSEMNAKKSSVVDCTDSHQEKCPPAACSQNHISARIPAENATYFSYSPLDHSPGISWVYNQRPFILSEMRCIQQNEGILRPIDHSQAYKNQRNSHLSLQNLHIGYRNFQNVLPQGHMHRMDTNLNFYAFGSLLHRAENCNGIYFVPSNESYFDSDMNMYL